LFVERETEGLAFLFSPPFYIIGVGRQFFPFFLPKLGFFHLLSEDFIEFLSFFSPYDFVFFCVPRSSSVAPSSSFLYAPKLFSDS